MPNLEGGGTSSLADYRGKIVVVNFWASWCVPCGDEAPILKRAQASLAKSGAGTVLGVTNNDAPDGSRQFLRKHGLDFPNVRDVGTKLWHDFGATGVPETFVLDARGRVVAIDHGQMANDDFLNNAIAKAKGAPA
jgi:cytochrome c biogenesis protein CcmG/thiol:disulfide interchange protein DsbE